RQGVQFNFACGRCKSASAEARERAERQQVAEAAVRARKVGVVAQAAGQPSREARLIGVDFPGMDVRDQREVLPGRASSAYSRIPEREDPQIASSTDRQILAPEQTKRRGGVLYQDSGRGRDPERKA